MFSVASILISSIKAFNDTSNIASYSPGYVGIGLSLAAFTLLRMAKSRFVQFLEPSAFEIGKTSIFTAINMLKQMSLSNNDLYAKCSQYLSTMWTHPSIFKTKDHEGWWKLRVRNRLSVSILFDTILIWVEEYGACFYGTPASDKQAPGISSSAISRCSRLMFFSSS